MDCGISKICWLKSCHLNFGLRQRFLLIYHLFQRKKNLKNLKESDVRRVKAFGSRIQDSFNLTWNLEKINFWKIIYELSETNYIFWKSITTFVANDQFGHVSFGNIGLIHLFLQWYYSNIICQKPTKNISLKNNTR